MSTILLEPPPVQPLSAVVARVSTPPELAADARSSTTVGTIIAMALIFIGSLPDAMTPPLLRQLMVERFGVSVSAAHAFASVGLVGGLLAVPLLATLRRRFNPVTIVIAAALANALLLAALALPIGLAACLVLRGLEGAADLCALAVLFDLVGKGGSPRRRGRRLGLAGTLMLLGLGVGALIGGRLGRIEPLLVFQLGAAACLIAAAIALLARRALHQIVVHCPAIEIDYDSGNTRRPLWPALAMIFSDRALAGLLATTVPLMLASANGVSPGRIGLLIALPLIIMALGSAPAGALGDQIGHRRLRTIAALLYALTFATLPLVLRTDSGFDLLVMAAIGIAGAALMPTSLALASRSGRGSVAMAAYQGAGNLGFLLGIAGAGAMLAVLSASNPGIGLYAIVIAAFAASHVLVTVLTAVALRPRIAGEPSTIAVPASVTNT